MRRSRRRINTKRIPRKKNSLRRSKRYSKKNIRKKNTKRRNTKSRIRSRNRINKRNTKRIRRKRRVMKGGDPDDGGPVSRPSSPDETERPRVDVTGKFFPPVVDDTSVESVKILPTPDGSGGVFVSKLSIIFNRILGEKDYLEFTDFSDCISEVKLEKMEEMLILRIGIDTSNTKPIRVTLTRDGEIIEYSSSEVLDDYLISQAEAEEYFKIFGINHAEESPLIIEGGGKIYGGFDIEIITIIEVVGFLFALAVTAIYSQEAVNLSEKFKRYIAGYFSRRNAEEEIEAGENIELSLSTATKAIAAVSNNISEISKSDLNGVLGQMDAINHLYGLKVAEDKRLQEVINTMNRSRDSLRLRVSSDKLEVPQANLGTIRDSSPVGDQPDSPDPTYQIGLEILAKFADHQGNLIDVEAGVEVAED